tara:strand:+ start:877 stop:1866 length:990 start_codon:yes stop_codon:yes gene_type:complete
MQAVVISKPGSPDVLTVEEFPDPTITKNEVLIKVVGAGVNRADLLQRRGMYPSPEGFRDEIPGLEVSGIIVQIGENVPKEWKEGQKVMALVDGEGYASMAAINHRMLMEVPSDIEIIHASGIPEVFLTAYDALVIQCGMKLQDKLLIHAVGSGVGTAAVQIAKEFDCQIFGTAGNDAKIDFAKQLGLQHGINYNEESFLEHIKSTTNKSGVDIILDVVGSGYLEDNVNSLSVKGRLIIIGLLGGDKANIQLGKILRNRLQIIGTVLRSRTLEEKINLTNQFKNDFLYKFSQKKIHPVIDRVYPYHLANEAHELMENNANTGKIILDFTT